LIVIDSGSRTDPLKSFIDFSGALSCEFNHKRIQIEPGDEPWMRLASSDLEFF